MIYSAKINSPHSEAILALPKGEAILTSLLAKGKAYKAKFRAKPKTFQPIMANFQPARVSALDHWVRSTQTCGNF